MTPSQKNEKALAALRDNFDNLMVSRQFHTMGDHELSKEANADDFVNLVRIVQQAIASLSQPTMREMNEWDEISKEDMWDEIQAIRKLTDNDGTMSPRQSVATLVEELKQLREAPLGGEVVTVDGHPGWTELERFSDQWEAIHIWRRKDYDKRLEDGHGITTKDIFIDGFEAGKKLAGLKLTSVTLEHVRDHMEKTLPDYGVWTDDILDAIHALIQSRVGGR